MTQLLHIVLLKGGFLNNMVEWILKNGGLFFLLFIVFAETGLFVGFFLPGDSLLFAAGIYLSKSPEGFYNLHYLVVALLIIMASALGNMVGYWFGLKSGPALYHKEDTWYFKRKHLLKAQDFYDHYGKGTVFLAKFVPIVRTFAPIVAGVVKMERPKFIFYNIAGSICWVLLMVLGGYFIEGWMQRQFNISLTDHIEIITLAIILVTTLPILYKLFFTKKNVVPTTPNDKDASL